MSDLWKIAVTVAGLSAVASFVFWSLYKQWLSAKVLHKLNSKQLFILFIIFLSLTFAFSVTALAVYLVAKYMDNSVEQRVTDANRVIENADEYVSYLEDRFKNGCAIIDRRRAFIIDVQRRSDEFVKARSEAIRNVQLGERIVDDGLGADAPLSGTFPTPPTLSVTVNHLEALNTFEKKYKETFKRLLESAKKYEFLRCAELQKDLRDMAESKEARFAFGHHSVVFVRAGLNPLGTPRYTEENDYKSLDTAVNLDESRIPGRMNGASGL